MDNHIHGLPQAINTLVLFSLLASANALAQDNTLAGAPSASTASALQGPSGNDCYKGERDTRLMLRIKDLSSLWHYATRVLRPTPDASMAPRDDKDRKTEKGVIWRVGTANGGVVMSASLPW